jgi:hypothetical protein
MAAFRKHQRVAALLIIKHRATKILRETKHIKEQTSYKLRNM